MNELTGKDDGCYEYEVKGAGPVGEDGKNHLINWLIKY